MPPYIAIESPFMLRYGRTEAFVGAKQAWAIDTWEEATTSLKRIQKQKTKATLKSCNF